MTSDLKLFARTKNKEKQENDTMLPSIFKVIAFFNQNVLRISRKQEISLNSFQNVTVEFSSLIRNKLKFDSVKFTQIFSRAARVGPQ